MDRVRSTVAMAVQAAIDSREFARVMESLDMDYEFHAHGSNTIIKVWPFERGTDKKPPRFFLVEVQQESA